MACGGGAAPFEVSPGSLAFGEVDFQASLPESGYNALNLTIENTGSRPIDVAFPAFPEDRLRVSALFASESPPTLATLEPGDQQTVVIGVIAYELGERDTLVETSLAVSARDARVSVPVTYTPVRDIVGGDSGL